MYSFFADTGQFEKGVFAILFPKVLFERFDLPDNFLIYLFRIKMS